MSILSKIEDLSILFLRDHGMREGCEKRKRLASMLQNIFPIFHLVLIGDPFTIEEVVFPDEPGSDQLFQFLRIGPPLQVEYFQGAFDPVALRSMDEKGGRFDIDPFDLRIPEESQKIGLKVDQEEKD
jgi:hypothetical protein